MKFDIYSRLYLAKHNSSSEKEDEMFNGCDPVIQNQVIKFARKLLLHEINDRLTIISLNGSELEDFLKYSDIVGTHYTLTDVTELAILGDLDIDKDSMDNVVLPYLEKNLTVDIILDKINIKGIKSLTKMDKNILKTNII